MKLSIKTQTIELTYEDEYSNLLEDVKKRLIEIIQNTIPVSNSSPTNNPKYVGTAENFFNNLKDIK